MLDWTPVHRNTLYAHTHTPLGPFSLCSPSPSMFLGGRMELGNIKNKLLNHGRTGIKTPRRNQDSSTLNQGHNTLRQLNSAATGKALKKKKAV